MTRAEKMEIRDRLCALVTDYEGSGSACPPTVDDFYEAIMEVINRFEELISEDTEENNIPWAKVALENDGWVERKYLTRSEADQIVDEWNRECLNYGLVNRYRIRENVFGKTEVWEAYLS